MSLIGFIVVAIIVLLIDGSKTAKAHKKTAEMKENGAFLPASDLRFSEIYQDMCRDWNEDRKLYPKEYWGYLERNDEARNEYSAGLTCQQEIKEGYQPTLCIGTYNKHTYDPFSFFRPYEKYIDIFNKTGKMYY